MDTFSSTRPTQASIAFNALEKENSPAFQQHRLTIEFALRCFHKAQVVEKEIAGMRALEKSL